MTRRNNKRNDRRSRNHNNAKEQAAHGAASMIMGAVLAKALSETFKDIDNTTNHAIPKPEEEPFNGVRQVSDNQINCGVIIPKDGKATEIPIPEGFEVFISEEGKPMIRKKVEGDGEPVNEQQPTTYEEVANQLYKDNKSVFCWIVNELGDDFINQEACDWEANALYNCTTEAQVKRLMAFNKLQNIALCLNKGWHPNFNCDEKKYFIMSTGFKKYAIGYNTYCNDGIVFFKTEELAKQAIRIMGDESLADLFNTDWYGNIR